jgi:hypothetical protein
MVADKYYRGVPMVESINHIGNITHTDSYKTPVDKPAERSGSGVRKDDAETSSKFILENNTIVFEKYDRQGKLISRVPWTAKSVNEKV